MNEQQEETVVNQLYKVDSALKTNIDAHFNVSKNATLTKAASINNLWLIKAEIEVLKQILGLRNIEEDSELEEDNA